MSYVDTNVGKKLNHISVRRLCREEESKICPTLLVFISRKVDLGSWGRKLCNDSTKKLAGTN